MLVKATAEIFLLSPKLNNHSTKRKTLAPLAIQQILLNDTHMITSTSTNRRIEPKLTSECLFKQQ